MNKDDLRFEIGSLMKKLKALICRLKDVNAIRAKSEDDLAVLKTELIAMCESHAKDVIRDPGQYSIELPIDDLCRVKKKALQIIAENCGTKQATDIERGWHKESQIFGEILNGFAYTSDEFVADQLSNEQLTNMEMVIMSRSMFA